MGQRGTTETVIGIYQAFLARRTWKQAELARELGVSTEAVRRVLLELLEKGMPLERQEDPPQVFWSVPKSWFPGSVLFKQDEVPAYSGKDEHADRTDEHPVTRAERTAPSTS